MWIKELVTRPLLSHVSIIYYYLSYILSLNSHKVHAKIRLRKTVRTYDPTTSYVNKRTYDQTPLGSSFHHLSLSFLLPCSLNSHKNKRTYYPTTSYVNKRTYGPISLGSSFHQLALSCLLPCSLNSQKGHAKVRLRTIIMLLLQKLMKLSTFWFMWSCVCHSHQNSLKPYTSRIC
jgi:hypothetical protein